MMMTVDFSIKQWNFAQLNVGYTPTGTDRASLVMLRWSSSVGRAAVL